MNKAQNQKKSTALVWILGILLVASLLFHFIETGQEEGVDNQPVENALLDSLERESKSLLADYQQLSREFEAELRKASAETDQYNIIRELLYETEERIGDLKELITTWPELVKLNKESLLRGRLERSKSEKSHIENYSVKALALVSKLNLIDNYERKIDSLNTEISRLGQSVSGNENRMSVLRKERDKLKSRIEVLKSTNLILKMEKDSLMTALKNEKSTVDSLQMAISGLNKELKDLREYAARNASLATRMDLWYYVKDKMKRPQRRELSNNPDDYNKGSEINTIQGSFSISYEKFEPFKIAEIKLFRKGSSKPVSQAKMTVRDQQSGEFSLLTNRELQKGEYTVKVYYSGDLLMEKDFYVSN